MKGFLGLLRLAVVGFALVAGGRALYRNKDKLKGNWKAVGGVGGLKGYTDKLSVGKLLQSVGPLKNLVSQVTRLK
jgi:hypothetical protein